MKPLLMMRTKGLTGPYFAHHTGISGLSKSAGNSLNGSTRAVRGWTGAVNCVGGYDPIFTVMFSGEVSFKTYLGGISIRNVTTGEDAYEHEAGSVSPTDQIKYSTVDEGTLIVNYGDVVTWSYDADVGDYLDSEGEPLESQTITLVNCVLPDFQILSIHVEQDEVPNGDKFIRQAVLEVKFNHPVESSATTGVIATVHGAVQSTMLSGSGTDTLRYRLQRAIYRHEVTWEYDGLGDIISALTGDPLPAVSQQIAANDLPEFTVWDYDAGAPDSDTDTTWDGDETRFDEEP